MINIKKISYSHHFFTLIAIFLGSVVGMIGHPMPIFVAKELGNLFMGLLKLLSAPMVFLAIVSTLTQVESLHTLKSLIKKILKYTILTTLIAATLGLFLFLLINPTTASSAKAVALLPAQIKGSYWGVIKNMIPDNILQPF
jgi:Na+/H+-dicarboxylate symporter